MGGDMMTAQKESVWNPWHGCHKISSGCRFCPVFQKDYKYGRNPDLVFKTKSFDLPTRMDRAHHYRLNPEDHLIHTCTTSDFFLPEADSWRDEAWSIMKLRPDLTFLISTKRPDRIVDHLPKDWNDGSAYENIHISCCVESQYTADLRLRKFITLPILHKSITVDPILGPVRISKYLQSGEIDDVSCSGESGPSARVCDFSWVLNLMLECVENNVPFRFEMTGSKFRKGNEVYSLSEENQSIQAMKACVNYSICG